MPKLDYRNLPLNEQLFLLQAALDHPCATLRRRAQAVSLLLQGGEPAEVARQLHFSPRVVDFLAAALLRRWQRRTDRSTDGRPREDLEGDYRQQLDVLLKADPMDYGYSGRDGWSAERLSDELACQTGILLGARRPSSPPESVGLHLRRTHLRPPSTHQQQVETPHAPGNSGSHRNGNESTRSAGS